jgi:hypothetical protein
MQRVETEQQGDQAATPSRPSHAVEQCEQRQGAQHVEAEVAEMVPSAVHAEELDVQHVGQPS